MASIQVSSLVAKMKNVDADFRFMALNDLMGECSKSHATLDSATEAQVVDQVLQLFTDFNSEVKNQAVKAIGALVKKVSEERLMFIIDSLIQYSSAPKDEQLRDLANLGLRTVIREIQPATALSKAASTGKMVPKLTEQLNNKSATPDMLLNAAELLHDLFARFESDIRPMDDQQSQALASLVHHLANSRPAVKKRVVDALAQLVAVAPPASDDLLQQLLATVIHPVLSGSSQYDTLTVVSLVGALVMRAPEKLGRAISKDSQLITKILAIGQSKSAGGNAGDAMEEDEGEEDSDTANLADLRELVLSTMERLLLKCPKELSPFVNATLALSANLISWDPNFAGGDEDDDMAEDEDADEEYDEEYSDDDDSSWKVRRSAARVFGAAFETRPDMLTYFVNTSAPLLIARFSEREQSVKLEVWSTYARLLNIVKLLDTSSIKSSITPGSPLTSRASREDTPTSLKRKRGAQESAMTLPSPPEEASLISAIAAQSPAVCKSILKQITPKNISSSQTGFTVLDALVSVLNGGLENQLSSFAPAIGYALPNASNPSQLDSSAGTVTSLKTTVLSFLAKVFISHSPASFGPSLKSQLVPCLVACTADKFNKIASGGFTAISALVKSLRAHKDAAPALSDQTAIVDILYKATASRLEASATDSEVRDSAVQTMGDLLANVGDALSVPAQQPLNLLTESLRREVTRVAAVRTSSKVAASSIMQSRPELSAWIAQSTPDVATFLRQSNRVLKVDSFACLPILIGAAGPSLPAPVAETVLQNTVTFISIDDLLLLPSAVNVLSALLQAQPQATVKSKTFIAALQQVYQLVESPLLQSGVALDSFLNFFSNLAQVSTPTDIIDKLKKTTSRAGPRCIGAVVQSKPELANEVADGFVTSASASKSSETSVIFSLYTLGEIGRVPDYQGAARAFQIALDKMNSGSDEEVRSAASFALGNLAVGSEDLVDQVIAHISSGDAHQAVLALHALKEFITHAQAPSIAARADSLWQPLFSICSIEGPPPPEASLPDDAKPEQKKARDQRIEAQFKENEPVRTKWMQTETSRSVAAECLGKITLLDPPRFLPQLQARVGDKLAGIRCAVITAIRFTLVDTSKEFEALLVPTVVSFLNLMRDQDLDVRRIALSTFNSAASHKPHLIRDSLSTLLPLLFEQTIVNPSFVRIVEMGPFKHKVDDGLEPRKAAYEACYTLLDTCLGRFDALEMLDCVLRGLTDDNEIRAICYLMLIRLAQVSPAATTLRLDAATPALTGILNEKLKDNAVKQEQERHLQIQRSALRAFVAVSRLASSTSAPKFVEALENIKNSSSPWASDYKQLISEPVYAGGADMDLD